MPRLIIPVVLIADASTNNSCGPHCGDGIIEAVTGIIETVTGIIETVTDSAVRDQAVTDSAERSRGVGQR